MLVKADGEPTYFAADCAYYLDKRERGFDKVVIMLGADHPATSAGTRRWSRPSATTRRRHLEILIGQLVNLVRDGEPVRMSKRAGTVVHLDDLVEAIGVDAARYALARASVDQQIDLDLDLWSRQTNDNPVFYVQYAHARISSVLRNAADLGLALGEPADVDVAQLAHQRESDLLRAIGEFPRVLAGAAELRAPHRVARYLEELAGTYHRFYDSCRVLPRGDEEATPLTTARLWLCAATAQRAAQRAGRARRARPGADVRRTQPRRPGRSHGGRWLAADGRRARPAAGARARSTRTSGRGRPSGSTASCTSAACRSPSWRRTHGTPLFVLDEGDFRGRAADFAGAFAGADVHYASKAFLCGQVARWIADDGLHLDACSGNELSLALAAGFPAERIALHGNNKSLVELRLAVDAGIGHIVVDSFDEIDRLLPLAAARVAAGGTPVPVLIRATVGIEAHTHEFIATAHEDQKFGFSLATGDALTAAVRVIREPALQLAGLHSHIGSQIFDTAGFEAAAHRVVGLLGQVRQATGEVLAELNLGGGFGIAYLSEDDPVAPPTSPAGCAPSSSASAPQLGLPVPRLAVEPGRAIAGPGTRDALRDRHDQAGAAGRSGHRAPAGAQLRVGRRRDERQHPHRALRRRATPCVLANRALRRAAGAVPRRGQALRERRHPGPRPVAAGGRRSRATCSPSPRPAPTAGRWRATTTTCSSRRWSRSRDGAATEIVRRQTTVRRVRPRRGPRRPAGDAPAQERR